MRVIGLYRKAQDCISVGELDEARTLLGRCLELDKRDAHSWLSLARLEARDGNTATARDLFVRASGVCPGNVRLLHAHAVLERLAGQPEEARRLFRQAAELEPTNAYVSHAWGLLEESMGNVSAARRIYAELMDARPQVQIAIAWAALEVHEGQLGRAREIYRRAWAVYGPPFFPSTPRPAVAPEPHATAADAGGASGAGPGAAAANATGGVAAEELTASEAEERNLRKRSRSGQPGERATAVHSRSVGGSSVEAVDILIAWARLERMAANATAARHVLAAAEARDAGSPKVPLERAALESACGNDVAARNAYLSGVTLPGHGATLDGSNGFSELFNAWATFEAKRGDVRAGSVRERAGACRGTAHPPDPAPTSPPPPCSPPAYREGCTPHPTRPMRRSSRGLSFARPRPPPCRRHAAGIPRSCRHHATARHPPRRRHPPRTVVPLERRGGDLAASVCA